MPGRVYNRGMDEHAAQGRQDALNFLRGHKTGVLATVSPEGAAHASMVYYTCDDDFNIYFLTLASTRKYQGLLAHPQVAFTVATPDVPQTLQLEGMAMDITLDPDAAKKKDELLAVLNSNPWFYGPIEKLDLADTVVVWVRPTWVRWADYAFADAGNAHVFTDIPVAE